MKNTKYFPYERNRYFYGKLLSVDDFELEQKYMNNKRRMLNRFLFGTGVVCGMHVIAVDDQTISIESGIAIDYVGREIVIDTPVVKKLSMIDGFDSYTEADENDSFLYLCADYAEENVDMVHSIAAAKTGNQEAEYNRVKEGYRLYLTKVEPDSMSSMNSNLYESTETIFAGNGIRIKQTIPRYVRSNDTFELKVTIENMGQQMPINFEYDLNLKCITSEGNLTHKVVFHEEEYVKATKYELTYPLRAMAVKDVNGEIVFDESSFKFFLKDYRILASAKGKSRIAIIAGNVKQEIMKRYYQGAMEHIVKNSYQQSIYLAKLSIMRAGQSYIINQVEFLPFQQFVYNNILDSAMNELTIKEHERTIQKHSKEQRKDSYTNYPQALEKQPLIATGEVVIDLGLGGKEGQKFYSDPIIHGLGLGKVGIMLGNVVSAEENSDIIYGDETIFDENNSIIKAKLAAKVDVKKGVFVVGIKLLETTVTNKIKVHWTAVKNQEEQLMNERQSKLAIAPNMLYLNVRETYYFQALLDDVIELNINWSLGDDNAGTIDENGMYTAPNQVGIYEVIATSKVQPRLIATAFVVVRDLKKEM